MRRVYQKGYVFQKRRKRSDAWQPEEPAFVQFWRDIPGQDQPTIDEQKQPTVDREEMEAILRESQEPYLTLYSLLAGCGPMRPREALGLDIRAIHPASELWTLSRKPSAASYRTT